MKSAANETVQRTGASRFAQRQIEPQRRLAPVADLCVMPEAVGTLPQSAEQLLEELFAIFPQYRAGYPGPIHDETPTYHSVLIAFTPFFGGQLAAFNNLFGFEFGGHIPSDMTSDDMALVREYAQSNSEQAFATLIARHVNLVHSVALRQVQDPNLAEEITQAVFIILARKAKSLNPKTILSGWLCRTARYVSGRALRTERRRRFHEREAQMQSTLNEPNSDAWQHIAPLLDEALNRLGTKEHDAIVLRFFDGKELKQVGTAMGTTEDGARMRENRGVEELRKFFTKRGITLSGAVIAGAVSTYSVQAAPVGLAKSVIAVALAKGAAASGSTLTLIKAGLKIMAWTKAKTAIAAGAAIILATTTTVFVAASVARRISADTNHVEAFKAFLSERPAVSEITWAESNSGGTTNWFQTGASDGTNFFLRQYLPGEDIHVPLSPTNRMKMPLWIGRAGMKRWSISGLAVDETESTNVLCQMVDGFTVILERALAFGNLGVKPGTYLWKDNHFTAKRTKNVIQRAVTIGKSGEIIKESQMESDSIAGELYVTNGYPHHIDSEGLTIYYDYAPLASGLPVGVPRTITLCERGQPKSQRLGTATILRYDVDKNLENSYFEPYRHIADDHLSIYGIAPDGSRKVLKQGRYRISLAQLHAAKRHRVTRFGVFAFLVAGIGVLPLIWIALRSAQTRKGVKP